MGCLLGCYSIGGQMSLIGVVLFKKVEWILNTDAVGWSVRIIRFEWLAGSSGGFC